MVLEVISKVMRRLMSQSAHKSMPLLSYAIIALGSGLQLGANILLSILMAKKSYGEITYLLTFAQVGSHLLSLGVPVYVLKRTSEYRKFEVEYFSCRHLGLGIAVIGLTHFAFFVGVVGINSVPSNLNLIARNFLFVA